MLDDKDEFEPLFDAEEAITATRMVGFMILLSGGLVVLSVILSVVAIYAR